jgi:uncharacterized protein YqfB (UPF0267 family)
VKNNNKFKFVNKRYLNKPNYQKLKLMFSRRFKSKQNYEKTLTIRDNSDSVDSADSVVEDLRFKKKVPYKIQNRISIP